MDKGRVTFFGKEVAVIRPVTICHFLRLAKMENPQLKNGRMVYLLPREKKEDPQGKDPKPCQEGTPTRKGFSAL